eukprot:CAMPEP_0114238944 /NCGR_PEP_ID=MMETSP0058-20121206/8189_1 /TAXON_ID=36894 /ORGANISM="Pyramimonas parkeae, CCMP726" /LENGTH=666 /DNA_ID=CAMNT_0001351077 /DNA_START=112 /DNA_END=2109 /DNA_ORIENTATION=-
MPLGKRAEYGDSRYAGLQVPFVADAHETLRQSMDCGFDFVVAPLVAPSRRPPPPPPKQGDPITPFLKPEDGLFLNPEWGNQVVGQISDWIDPDSAEEAVAKSSAVAFGEEMGWATHLSLQAVLLHPKSAACVNLARLTNQILQGLHHMQVWVGVPATAAEEEEASQDSPELDADSGLALKDPYVWWHQMRIMCESNPSLGVCLRVGPTLPHAATLQRWIGEPLRAVILSTSAFTTNKRGYPTLSKRHQDFITLCFKHNVQVILSDQQEDAPTNVKSAPAATEKASDKEFPALGAAEAGADAGCSSGHAMRAYWEYVVYLFRRMDEVDENEQMMISYRDYLQAPLQPLMDNLENQTYETFEKDDTKYVMYEKAVRQALLDRVSEAEKDTKDTLLMVVGAGRGPLVSASLRAAASSQRNIQVYAVEKNPNAVVTLQRHLATDPLWKDKVTLIHADMRFWEAPRKADILVSELLGSFGDNELSPECLDGAQRFLREDGISIPCEYTSYLAPMTSAKLYKDCKAYKDREHFETAYVVKTHNVAVMAEALPVFTFKHPNWETHIDNTRSIKLKFEPLPDTPSATMHGFVGYFDAKLYGDVHISTFPKTETTGMFSWFPIYFPMIEPIHVPVGRKVEAHFWRCVSSSKVWYEWTVTSPKATPVHNVNGRSYW